MLRRRPPPLLFIEGDILNYIIKFPHHALLHIEAALLLVGWMDKQTDKLYISSGSGFGSLGPHAPEYSPRHE